MSWVGTLLLLLLGTATADELECAGPVSPTALGEAMDVAESRYRDLDDEGFRDKVNEIAGLLLPCVEQAMGAELAARYHRLMAMHLHANGNEPGAFRSVQAARNVAPDAAFDPELVPENHPLMEAWLASEQELITRRVPEPRSGALSFDGRTSRERPRSEPTLAQVFDDSGRAIHTTYLGEREPLPSYRAIPRQRNGLIACAGSSLAVSGATWGLSFSSRSALLAAADDPSFQVDKLRGMRGRTNALAVFSASALGVSLGCGSGAVLIGER